MPTTKTYNKAGDQCKVRFKLAKPSLEGAKEVFLAADFTNWAPIPMKKLKDGSASLEQTVKTGCDYQYRYVLDGDKWVNDPEADDYTQTEFEGVENSVLKV